MPIGVTDEEDVQINEDYPYLPVEGENEELLAESISHRITVAKEIQTLTGVKKVIDGSIHEIINEHLYNHETADSLKGGYSVDGDDGEEVQIQITKRYPAKNSAIKKKKGREPRETNVDILELAEIFDLEPQDDGTFSFPVGTFLYKDAIKVDPSKVSPAMFEDFVKDVKALGQKYKQGKMNPVSEKSQLVASPTFHLGRLKLPEETNLKLHNIFQNITIKLLNEEEE